MRAQELTRQQERRWGEMFREPVRSRGTDSARVIQVIESKSLRGAGTEEDPCRLVAQYWDFDGNLLAENDPCAKEKE